MSVVAPCYNEEQVIHEFVRRTLAACETITGSDFEVVLINDGSSDATWQLICEYAAIHPTIVGVNLARNHGHQIAVTAGLALASGERVLIIDADLQDPPELLADMMSKMDEGFDVVYGQRKKRSGETRFKLLTAKIFYRLLHRLTQVEIPADTGDFRLINRRTVDLLNQMPEQQRFLRGMVAWLGGRQTPLSYDRDARFAGETKYTLRKMVRLAVDAITSFSAAPLRIATVFALVAGMIAIGLSIYTLISYLFFEPVPGWTSTLIVILIFSAAQLISLGIIGEYLGRLYIQSKGRPLFMISEVISSKSALHEESDELRSVG